jgi:hypothetical protein
MSSIVDTSLSNLPQPKSGWQLFKNLAFGEIAPGLAWEKPPIDVSSCCVHWRHRSAPLACCRSCKTSAPDANAPGSAGLPCRLHRPWLTVNMDRQRALESLSWHYQMMSRQLPATLTKGYLSKQGVTADLNRKR